VLNSGQGGRVEFNVAPVGAVGVPDHINGTPTLTYSSPRQIGNLVNLESRVHCYGPVVVVVLPLSLGPVRATPETAIPFHFGGGGGGLSWLCFECKFILKIENPGAKPGGRGIAPSAASVAFSGGAASGAGPPPSLELWPAEPA